MNRSKLWFVSIIGSAVIALVLLVWILIALHSKQGTQEAYSAATPHNSLQTDIDEAKAQLTRIESRLAKTDQSIEAARQAVESIKRQQQPKSRKVARKRRAFRC